LGSNSPIISPWYLLNLSACYFDYPSISHLIHQSISLIDPSTQHPIMKLLAFLPLAIMAIAAPVPHDLVKKEAEAADFGAYGSYGDYAPPPGGFGSYGDYAGAPAPENPPPPAGGFASYGDYAGAPAPENPPPPEGGFGSYGDYPTPPGGYGSYGSYKE
jgi:hypothetical protein